MISYWNDCEKNVFYEKTDGQINLNVSLGQILKTYAENEDIHTILEIGTWNGLGSTKCIVTGLLNRKNQNDYLFYSLECNHDKYLYAKKYYKDIPNIFILNDVLFNSIDENEIENIFPEIKTNEMFMTWLKEDLKNIENKQLFFDRNDVPTHFDLIILDGSEFLTYFEYILLKDKCKILILDDVNTLKSSKIIDEIKKDSENWTIINLCTDERNGYCVALNRKLENSLKCF
jgi:hypothetical protein